MFKTKLIENKTQELATVYVSTRGPGSIIGDEVLDFPGSEWGWVFPLLYSHQQS